MAFNSAVNSHSFTNYQSICNTINGGQTVSGTVMADASGYTLSFFDSNNKKLGSSSLPDFPTAFYYWINNVVYSPEPITLGSKINIIPPKSLTKKTISFTTDDPLTNLTINNATFSNAQDLYYAINSGQSITATVNNNSLSFTFSKQTGTTSVTETATATLSEDPTQLSYSTKNTPNNTIFISNGTTIQLIAPSIKAQRVQLQQNQIVTNITLNSASKSATFSNATELYNALNTGETISAQVNQNALTFSFQNGTATATVTDAPTTLTISYTQNNNQKSQTIPAINGTQININGYAQPQRIILNQNDRLTGLALYDNQNNSSNFTYPHELYQAINTNHKITSTVTLNSLTFHTPLATSTASIANSTKLFYWLNNQNQPAGSIAATNGTAITIKKASSITASNKSDMYSFDLTNASKSYLFSEFTFLDSYNNPIETVQPTTSSNISAHNNALLLLKNKLLAGETISVQFYASGTAIALYDYKSTFIYNIAIPQQKNNITNYISSLRYQFSGQKTTRFLDLKNNAQQNKVIYLKLPQQLTLSSSMQQGISTYSIFFNGLQPRSIIFQDYNSTTYNKILYDAATQNQPFDFTTTIQCKYQPKTAQNPYAYMTYFTTQKQATIVPFSLYANPNQVAMSGLLVNGTTTGTLTVLATAKINDTIVIKFTP
ncbi:hypothetical protein HYV11_02215 [Candidatus Dependentiae bacterium]|nr:hypothetical protein [Candidatus Dependentiae bacterium]